MKKLARNFTMSLLIASFFTMNGCAPSAEKISATYTSPLLYQNYSCAQIREEMMRVSRKVNDLSGTQDRHASGDAVAMGVGLVVFWPALFFLASKDQRTDLARLKGEFDALEESAIQKNCSVKKEIEAARKLETKRLEEKEKEQESNKQKSVNQ